MQLQHIILALSVLVSLAQAPSTGLKPDPPIACSDCDAWNARRDPFKVFGNTYYVGPAELSSLLIASDAGLILLDGALPQSAAIIDANIRRLGFRTEDVRLIVNSHTHYDHAGGIAALQRASGATVAVSASSAKALERGGPTPDDPQFAFKDNGFPAVKKVRIVADGEELRVGNIAITAHLTPGHTPGGTTWSWRSCEGERCMNLVYADSLNAVSAPGFRFTGDATHPSLVDTLRRSIATVAALPCDIIISVHPGLTNLDKKLQGRAQQQGASDPFVDANECRTYAADATKRLDARVAEETTKK